MINLKFEEQIIQVPSGFTCDKCKTYHSVDDYIEWQEKLSVSMVGGYGAVYGDGAQLEFDLCQDCMFDMVKEFVRVSGGAF